MARRLRITGLVRMADAIRRELGRPIRPEQRDRLRSSVSDALMQVARMLADAGMRENRLPAPSRRAMEFLRSIDWENVSISDEAAASTRISAQLAWRGLGTFVERAMQRLSEPPSADEAEAVRQSIARMSRQIEGTIARQNVSPEQIAPSARALRGWLALLARPEDFRAYLDAQRIAREKLAIPPEMARRFPRPLLIQFRPMRGIYRLSRKVQGSLLQLPTGSIAFGPSEFADVASLVFERQRGAKERVVAHMTSEGFQSIGAEVEALSGIVPETHGAFHDLADSFDRVNAKYFSGVMPRPRLTWSRSFTGRKFGHYDWIVDTVMVSRTLDARDVPTFVVDYIMYHELLHKKHGLRWVEGRGYAHTADFYRDERRFEQHHEAEQIIERLARGRRPV